MPHQKGIIHRDLKPSNVLVTEVDGRPTPKVIDFGVAKAAEFSLTDLSLADTGAIVGTPAYMSPEQADPSSMDIDTQGQRPLKCFSGNNFQKEVLGPPTTSTLHGDAVAARVLLQE